MDHAEAYVNMSTVKDSVTNEEIQPDEQFMNSIEEQIGITGTSKENFRVDITAFMFSNFEETKRLIGSHMPPSGKQLKSN